MNTIMGTGRTEPHGALAELLGPRPTMWLMTGLPARCRLLLALGPTRGRRDLPTAKRADRSLGAAPEPAQAPASTFQSHREAAASR